jgi:pilus assembly protein CpaE
VLLKPLEIGEAREVFGRVLDRSPAIGVKASTLGKALVFMHLSGGVGATTLAVNSACALARAHNVKKTCLVDLDIQFGNSASQLDLMSASPVQEFIDDPARLDEAMLESMMQRHSTGLRVLTSPRELLPLNSYSAEGIRHLVELAKRQFGFSVLDLPVALAPWTEAVLKEAAVIYLVTSTSVPSAHRVMKFLDLLQEEGVRDLPLRIVVNRHQRSSRHTNDISLSQFEKALKRKVDFAIPNDYSLISLSHGQGRPAVGLKPKSPFSTALMEMLATDLGNDVVSLTKRSFFSFGRT